MSVSRSQWESSHYDNDREQSAVSSVSSRRLTRTVLASSSNAPILTLPEKASDYTIGDLVLMKDHVNDRELVGIVKRIQSDSELDLFVPTVNAIVINVGIEIISPVTYLGGKGKECDIFRRLETGDREYWDGDHLMSRVGCQLLQSKGAKHTVNLDVPSDQLDFVTLRKWSEAAGDPIRDAKTGLLLSASILRKQYQQRLARSIDSTVKQALAFLELVPDCDVEARKRKSIISSRQRACDQKIKTCRQIVSFKEDALKLMSKIQMDQKCLLRTNLSSQPACREPSRIIEDAAAVQAQTSAIITALRSTFKRFQNS